MKIVVYTIVGVLMIFTLSACSVIGSFLESDVSALSELESEVEVQPEQEIQQEIVREPRGRAVEDRGIVYRILRDSNFGVYTTCGESDWYGTTTDDERIHAGEELLSLFQDLGYDASDWTSNTFAQAMNDYYDQNKSESVWEVACTVFGVEAASYESVYQEVIDTYQILEGSNFQSYIVFGESDWYGATTDEERIRMAEEILDVFQRLGYDISADTPNAFAQMINDAYDIDKSRSIWDVACEGFGISAEAYKSIYREVGNE